MLATRQAALFQCGRRVPDRRRNVSQPLHVRGLTSVGNAHFVSKRSRPSHPTRPARIRPERGFLSNIQVQPDANERESKCRKTCLNIETECGPQRTGARRSRSTRRIRAAEPRRIRAARSDARRAPRSRLDAGASRRAHGHESTGHHPAGTSTGFGAALAFCRHAAACGKQLFISIA
jgi:hypothetical protein